MWATWGQWGACSATCGDGTRQRTRECTDPSSTGAGVNCSPGSASENEDCNDAICRMYIYVN